MIVTISLCPKSKRLILSTPFFLQWPPTRKAEETTLDVSNTEEVIWFWLNLWQTVWRFSCGYNEENKAKKYPKNTIPTDAITIQKLLQHIPKISREE